MLETNIIGIANVELGSLSIFRNTESGRTVSLPREFLDFPDQEEIEAWACREGYIRRGERVAISQM